MKRSLIESVIKKIRRTGKVKLNLSEISTKMVDKVLFDYVAYINDKSFYAKDYACYKTVAYRKMIQSLGTLINKVHPYEGRTKKTYHDVKHFALVLSHAVRISFIHEDILIKQTPDALKKHIIYIIMMSAILHDYGYGSPENKELIDKGFAKTEEQASAIRGLSLGEQHHILPKDALMRDSITLLIEATYLPLRPSLHDPASEAFQTPTDPISQDIYTRLKDTGLLAAARVLSDADLSESLYSGHKNYLIQSKMLEKEIGSPITKEKSLAFINLAGPQIYETPEGAASYKLIKQTLCNSDL